MKTSRLFLVLFAISTLSSSLYAGQTNGNGDQGTNSESDCDYFPAQYLGVRATYWILNGDGFAKT